MKKTLTVNLGGTVFQLDEDAYILLDDYLSNLRYHFRKEKGGDEIVSDMEMRISELFAETLEGGQQVITIDNVEAVIARMGRPEQLEENAHWGTDAEGDEEQKVENENDDEQKREAYTGPHEENVGAEKVTKRLFRDVDHRVLGGVLSGIAAYFGWDPTALRLVYIVIGLLPTGPSVLIIYLILLFIIPPARTATEKLQMKGEPINMENIGKTVRDGFERENKANPSAHRTGLQLFLDVIVNIVGILVKVFVGIVLICCIPVLFVGFVALFSLLMSVLGIFVHMPSVCCHLLPNLP